ncbi:16432_t:CDS:2 [Rhizophagus irregularis]|nr:16432_t:CDS:2 [Rhizophagus irregularis]
MKLQNENELGEEINENGIEEETGRGVMDFRVVDLSKEFNDKQLNDENYENEYDE